MQSPNIEDRLSRLRWACQRTQVELTAPLTLFLENSYVDLTMSERFAFERLLSSSDTEISAWFSGEITPRDQGIGDTIKAIHELVATRDNLPKAS